MSIRFGAFLIASLIFTTSVLSQQLKRGDLRFEPFSLMTFDGQSHPAELGRLAVPENRRQSSNRLITIAFVRLKSTAQQPAAPIVFLAGGPGIPGAVMARVPVYYDLFDQLRQVADVILLDQRGSGMSSPNLDDCPAQGQFPLDAFTTRQRLVNALAGATQHCADYWLSRGVDLTAYNTEESADDVDDLRQALGAGRVSLLGHSYGTELALAMIRRHGGSVERAVLSGTEGPGDHGTMPNVFDLQLKKIARLVADDATMGRDVPDAAALFHQDLQKLQKQPSKITITRQSTKTPVELAVGDEALRFVVEQMLADGRAIVSLPALLKSIGAGDYSLLEQRIGALYNGFDGHSGLMGRTMNCSAPTPPARLVQTKSEAESSAFGDVIRVDMQPEICKAAVGDFVLDADYFAPLYSTVPTLFLSGSMDANCPPMKADRMRWGFPNSLHLVIDNGFHETLPAEKVQAVAVDFFRGRDVGERYISFAPPHFLSVEEAKKAAGGRR